MTGIGMTQRVCCTTISLLFLLAFPCAWAQPVSLDALVTPSTVILKESHPLTFAIHGFIEFKSLAEAFQYVDLQSKRWSGNQSLDDAARQKLVHDLVREAVESRVVSMVDERPLQTIFTHTAAELRKALAAVKEPTPHGYADALPRSTGEMEAHSLNCWSASPSIPGRVRPNWYPMRKESNSTEQHTIRQNTFGRR